MKIFPPPPAELTQDDLNRMQLEIAFLNAGQIKHAADVAGIVFLIWLVADLILIYTGH